MPHVRTRLRQLRTRVKNLRRGRTTGINVPREFPIARIGNGTVAHYVDDYRYQPGRTICGRPLPNTDAFLAELDRPLCTVCAKRKNHYPTKDEFDQYLTCTDCGIDTRTECGYGLKHNIWEIAYPGYSRGIGVGSSRPCIGCLEKRLGRPLTAADFNWPKAPDPTCSDRLNQRVVS